MNILSQKLNNHFYFQSKLNQHYPIQVTSLIASKTLVIKDPLPYRFIAIKNPPQNKGSEVSSVN